MQMTKEQTSYYLTRLLLFRSKVDLCNMLNCSRPSLDRWSSGQGLPDVKYLEAFEQAWDDELDRLEQKGFPLVAEAFEADPRPSSSDRQRTRRGPKFNTKWLRDTLANHKRVPYQKLVKKAADLGITQSQLQYAGRLIGVH